MVKDGNTVIIFGTYNIQNVKSDGIKSALREMEQANMDLGFLEDTKFTNGVHMRLFEGYHVLTADAQSSHQREYYRLLPQNPPLPSQVILAARAEYGKLPTGLCR